LNEFEIIQNTVEINSESSHNQRAVSSITEHINNLQEIKNAASLKKLGVKEKKLIPRVLEKYGVPYPGHMSTTYEQSLLQKEIADLQEFVIEDIKLGVWDMKFLSDIPEYIKDLDLKIIGQSFNE